MNDYDYARFDFVEYFNPTVKVRKQSHDHVRFDFVACPIVRGSEAGNYSVAMHR